MSEKHFAFLDVETTGVEDDAKLLEVAIIQVDPDDWAPLAVYHQVFFFQPSSYTGKIYEAHHKNNLLIECQASNVHSWAWEPPPIPEQTIAIGRNVHFDLGVLKRCIPELHKRFHYRTLDLTSVELLHGQGRKIESTHRALHDCLIEMHHMRGYRAK